MHLTARTHLIVIHIYSSDLQVLEPVESRLNVPNCSPVAEDGLAGRHETAGRAVRKRDVGIGTVGRLIPRLIGKSSHSAKVHDNRSVVFAADFGVLTILIFVSLIVCN